jgi:hypothetical protein
MCQDGSRKVLYQLALSGSAHRLFLFGTSIQQLPANPKHRHSSADGQFPFTPLLVRWMLTAHLRQVLRRPEFNRDVLLNLDRPFVQESRPVTPQANGAHCGRKKRNRSAHELYILHVAGLSDRGSDLYRFCRSISIPRHWIPRPNEEDKLTSLQPSRSMSLCGSGLRRNKNGKFRGHCDRRRRRDRFFRESHPEWFASVGRGSDKDCGRR